jgi:nicotinamidase/pyrazinamidase
MDKYLSKAALIIVDVQNDFIPGGSLAVSEGDQIVPLINQIQKKFNHVIATQDFHPADHGSFAAIHPGKIPGDLIELGGLKQILWPVHCVQNTQGSEFHPDLDQSRWEAVFQKGKNPLVDSYSGFFDNARRGDTGLGDYLKSKGIELVFICGLALDYCVKFTALDAHSLGFRTYLVQDATRAVNISSQDGEKALEEMKNAGVIICSSKEL